MQLAYDSLLHQIHRRNLHHSHPNSSQQRRRRISRPVQIRQPMPNRRGQTQPRPRQQPPQTSQNRRASSQQHRQHTGKPKREHLAHRSGVRQRSRNRRKPTENQRKRHHLRQVLTQLAQHRGHKRIIVVLNSTPQNQNRPHAAYIQQRRKRKQQRRQNPDAKPRQHCPNLNMNIDRNIDVLRQQIRKRQLHSRSQRNADQPTQQAQHQRLKEIYLDYLPRASAERLHNRNRVQPLLQMR